ncbi:LysR family transcriptional regulator [Oleiagrimonas sp. C23AA]|uniref:LysR family transcriptional regulator n=1 Tax=Oleiagrimonas sp. C23AA TaxID=2719047 RepID=UPI00141F1FF2|nr:LysR family transcriptional regulator [Oleiagrimonas sp. C23AA]NII09513.1 LysR family transcriptional regulator [Oleiagrimonas sp. C23AA]
MADIDLNLLLALDALLAERSVTAAAHRLDLSVSAMSRTLKRLRKVTGDPLLVRAGRGLVPTPHALALRERVQGLTQEVRTVLSPPRERLQLATLAQTFTLRANESFVQLLAAPLVAAVAKVAPRVQLRFVAKPDKAPAPLREGRIDLEIGVVDDAAPELRTQALFHDRWVGLVRRGHPLLAVPTITANDLTRYRHAVAAPGGRVSRVADEALDALGLVREVGVVVPGFPDAMRMAAASELVAVVPHSCLGHAMIGEDASAHGVEHFELPLALPGFTISAIWHPRLDADPAQRWLRGLVSELCRRAYPAH